ncbi:MAG: hypothetical protein J3K34DRAFT_525378 [Monoraphidium minutum]|nr:MAG: hypothetical protein J3K34DRAFT_525378 [Monoraphidium minutum]
MAPGPQRHPRAVARRPLFLAPLALLLLAAALPRRAAAGANGDAMPSFKFLTLVPFGGSSHTFDLIAVAGALAQRHDVTVAAPASGWAHTAAAAERLGGGAARLRLEPVQELPSMRDIMPKFGTMGGSSSKLKMVSRLAKLPPLSAAACGRMLENRTLMEASRGWKQHDALVTFTFPVPADDSCPCLLAHALGVPLLHVRDVVLMDAPWTVPQFGSGLTRADVRGTWLGALKNVASWAMQQALLRALGVVERSSQRALRAQHGLQLGGGGGRGEGRSCVPLVQAVSANWLLQEPQPLEAYQVMVGALSPHPSRPAIPDAEIAAFAAAAAAPGEAGLVLVSFGSMSAMFGASLVLEDFKNLAAAFASLAPVRVLWQLDGRAVPGGGGAGGLPLGANTRVVPWAPLNDVLGHAACRAFVTHCGLKSVYEAMFHGVPILGVPFMGEQLHNARRAAARGLGAVSPEAAATRAPGQTFTKDGVAGLVREVLAPSYAEAAARVGEAMRHAYAFKRPVDRAVEEFELALVAGGFHRRGGGGGGGERGGGGGAGEAAEGGWRAEEEGVGDEL